MLYDWLEAPLDFEHVHLLEAVVAHVHKAGIPLFDRFLLAPEVHHQPVRNYAVGDQLVVTTTLKKV